MRRFRTPRVGFTALVLVALLGPLAFAGAAGAGSSSRNRFVNDMNGANENPDADPDGRGIARIELTADATAGTGEVCFKVTFDRTGTPNRGHIHVGVAEANGGIVVPLFELVGMPADARNDALERGRLEDCVPADPAVVQLIVANPAGYYVNLHNARYPGGAIRCQLVD
jgi:hypothetical protein